MIFEVLKYEILPTQNYPEFRMHSISQDVEICYQVTISVSLPVPFLQLSKFSENATMLDFNNFAHYFMALSRPVQEPEGTSLYYNNYSTP